MSCALESKYALPNEELINTNLLGDWYGPEDPDNFVRISKRTDKTYTVTVFEKDEKQVVSQAFSKSIKGYNILNLITTTDDKSTNIFVGFTVNGNSLTYFDVTNKLREDDFSSKKELLDFFENHISNEGFFQDPIELKKK
jgi:hypothetical protein